ncbi:hypothetical protein Tco_0381653 [Tanacetum coccineum]
MADVNAPVEQAPAVAPPTRTDEQILPRIRWVPIGKSNCYLDAEKSQSNPIYKIAVDILKQTNFFRAFTASSTIPAIYIQQFWDTICYDRTDGGYKCQLDEQWFNLTKDTLRDALRITPVNNNKAFSSPPTQDTLINFVNDLGYPKEVKHLSNVVTNDMFQPWRALTTIINLCLTGKTSGFERPRAPVLQILWGIINRAHIDYAERMWEEFTQSIHTFTEDKKNLAQNTQGKKKATLIVIPSVRFTKLIIFHLQRKHKFHPRLESPLHLPTKEPIMGYLKFSAKGTKREVFGMPIPNELITDDIRGAYYYDSYLEKVAKHQRYLAGEEVSDPDSPAPKPAKSTKPKVTKQAKPVAPKAATKKPQPALTKPKEKKRKQTKETIEATPPAKRAKAGKGIPLTEPRFGDLEADTQRAIEESLKDAHGAPRGPLLHVVFRETDTRKFQPLPERRTSAPTKPSGHDESSSIYVTLGLPESDMELDEEMPPVVKSGDQDEGQARPDPGIQDKGQAGPNPDDVAESLPLSTPGVHAGPNLEHTDAEATDATSQPQPKHMDEEFTTTAYPNVQENLKLTVDEPVIPEEPASSIGTLLENQDIPNQVSKAVDEIVTDAVDWAMQAPLRERFRDLPKADMKEILHNRIDQLLSDLAEARKKKKKRQGSPKTTPARTPLLHLLLHHQQGGKSTSTATPSSSKTAASTEYTAWTTIDTRLKPSVSPILEELHMDDDTNADEQAYSSSGEDVGRDHIPTVNLRQSWWKPLTETDCLHM